MNEGHWNQTDEQTCVSTLWRWPFCLSIRVAFVCCYEASCCWIIHVPFFPPQRSWKKTPSLQVYAHEIFMTWGGWGYEVCLWMNCVYTVCTSVLNMHNLQEAGSGSPEDLDVGAVWVGKLQSVSQPNDWHVTGISFDLTANIDWISLPGVHCNCSMDLRSIYKINMFYKKSKCCLGAV